MAVATDHDDRHSPLAEINPADNSLRLIASFSTAQLGKMGGVNNTPGKLLVLMPILCHDAYVIFGPRLKVSAQPHLWLRY